MKIYVNKVKESWIIDRVTTEWIQQNENLSTNKIKEADIVWIIAHWVWDKIPKKYLKTKKVVASIYHIDFDNFDEKQEKDFYNLDQYVDQYHVISLKTKLQLSTLTKKEIISIPFWVNQENYFYKNNKTELRKELGFQEKDYLVGSFQRDTEGSDLISPKLIKGPDIFVNIARDIHSKNKNLTIVLAGTRRQYVIKQLEELGIKYKYFEMANLEMLNNLYNVLDLYIVTSRLEGGPQAILESAITKTPLISTDVGVATEILSNESIFQPEFYEKSKPNVEYAFKNADKFKIPQGMREFNKMFNKVYEN
tara:strand:- start:108 stop:1031 length:924 start_codon:yes stop_codon:yes gene_type:complete